MDRQEYLVDVETAEGRRGELAAGPERGRPDHAAGHDHRRPGFADQFDRVRDGRRDHDQVPLAVERPGQTKRRRAGVEDDRAPVGDELRCPSTDGQLLVGMLAQPERRVRLIARTQGDRAAMGAPDDAQFSASRARSRRMVSSVTPRACDQVPTSDAAPLPDQVGDHLKPIGWEHLLTHGHHSCIPSIDLDLHYQL